MVVTVTIAKNEYQDCIQELQEKLADERKLNSTQNKRNVELEEQIGKQVDFILKFEVWLEDYSKGGWGRYVIDKWHEFKAQHLDNTETEAS